MERPYNQIVDTVRALIDKSRDTDKFIFEKSDSIALWLIGLSASGIPIIIGNFNGIKQLIGNTYFIQLILVLLLIAVVSGLFYRITYLFFFAKLSVIMEIMTVNFTRRQTMDTTSFLTGNETYQELVFMLDIGFGKNYEDFIPMYNQSDDGNKKILYDTLVDYYNNNVAWAAKDAELALDFTDSQFRKYLGISPKKHNENREINLYKWSRRLSRLFYIIFMLSFIIALIVFVFSANIN